MRKKQQQGYAETGINPNYDQTKRQSIEPTYDSAKDGKQYSISTGVNNHSIGSKDLDDPFVTHTVRVSFLDTLKGLLRGGVVVRVSVDGKNRRIVEDVMELNANYLGINCTRRDGFNKDIMQAASDHITREMGED
jgi:hypothetical protein